MRSFFGGVHGLVVTKSDIQSQALAGEGTLIGNGHIRWHVVVGTVRFWKMCASPAPDVFLCASSNFFCGKRSRAKSTA